MSTGNQRINLSIKTTRIGEDTLLIAQDDSAALNNSSFVQLFQKLDKGVAIFQFADNRDDFLLKNLNPAGCRISQLEIEAVINQPVESVFPGIRESGILSACQQAFQSGEQHDLAMVHYQEGGKDQWFKCCIYKSAADEVTLIYDNISHQKRLEADLKRVHKMEVLGKITRGITHDFNNLMATILGFADLAHRTHASSTPEKQKHYLSMILKSGQKARSLITQMQMFNKPTEVQRQNTESAGLSQHLRDNCKLLESSMPSTISIQIDTPEALPELSITMQQFQHIVLNLCDNAREAMGNSGILNIKLEPRRAQAKGDVMQRDWVVLSISDSGPGMTESIQENIFTPFFTTKKWGTGSGLGLTVVRNIVNEAGGFIDVASEPGQGSSFHLYLPVAEKRSDEQ